MRRGHHPGRPRRQVAIALVLAVAGACGGSGEATPPSSTLRVADPLELVVLENRLIVDVPEGFVVAEEEGEETGPTDLVKAVRDQGGGSDVREFFVENGFTIGYQRRWTGPRSEELLVFLYQFASADGAAAQARSIESSIRSNAGRRGVGSFATGVPGAMGLENADPSGPVVAVVFSKGPHWVLVRLAGRNLEALKATASDLARDQYDRLP